MSSKKPSKTRETRSKKACRGSAQAEREKRTEYGDVMTPGEKAGSMAREAGEEAKAAGERAKRNVRDAT